MPPLGMKVCCPGLVDMSSCSKPPTMNDEHEVAATREVLGGRGVLQEVYAASTGQVLLHPDGNRRQFRGQRSDLQ